MKLTIEMHYVHTETIDVPDDELVLIDQMGNKTQLDNEGVYDFWQYDQFYKECAFAAHEKRPNPPFYEAILKNVETDEEYDARIAKEKQEEEEERLWRASFDQKGNDNDLPF